MGESHWFWNNGTRINDLTFQEFSNTSACEDMTWPLTYDDGVNLRARKCGSGKSNFVCRYNLNYTCKS